MSLKVVRNLKPLFGGFARTRVITHPWSTANFDAFARLLDKFELALGSLTFPEKLDEKKVPRLRHTLRYSEILRLFL